MDCLYYQILMSVKAVFHAVKYAIIHWAVTSVVVIVDIQWMAQDVMVSDCNIITHYY